MKRFRVKLVGLGFAALAGSALASDDPVRVSVEPAPFPTAAVQFGPAPGALDRNDPLWFSATRPQSSQPSATIPPGPVQASGVESFQNRVITSSPLPASGGAVCPSCELPHAPAMLPDRGVPPIMPSVPVRVVEFPNGLAPKPLPVRLLLTWLQADVTVESWPPIGPRVGLLPPIPASEAPARLPVTQPVAALSAGNDRELVAQAAPMNQLPLPAPLQTQTPQPATQSPEPRPQAAPSIPQQMPRPAEVGRPAESSKPIPAPATQPAPAAQPAPAQPLPQPRLLEGAANPTPAKDALPSPQIQQPQPVCELPTAPPELMTPSAVEAPGRSGNYNSEPIRLSHDFPSLSEICGTPIRDRLRAGLTEDRPALDRGYVEVEQLMWWMSGMRVPTLATTSTTPTGTGFLGMPGTTSLLGPGDFLGSYRDGFRLRAGAWLDDCSNWGLDGSFFILGQRNADAAFSYNQYGVITRPIFSPNPIPGGATIIGETGEAVSLPGALAGVLTVHAQSVLFGADANLTSCLFRDCDSHAILFVGYRNLDLLESLKIDENIQVIGAGGGRIVTNDPIGSLVAVQDRFGTQNCFNGGQIGATYERRWGNFDVDARASIAFGVTNQQLDISGFQTVTLPGRAAQSFRGGLLAVGPNLGDFSRDRFSVAPEMTLNFGYWITPNFKLYAGYNFLYWTDVIRPGEQIDRVVNLSYVPNAPPVGASNQVRPQALFAESNMLVHGVQIGLEWRW
jgi:hypothetical protein